MNGSIFTLGAVGALAAMGALSKRGGNSGRGSRSDGNLDLDYWEDQMRDLCESLDYGLMQDEDDVDRHFGRRGGRGYHDTSPDRAQKIRKDGLGSHPGLTYHGGGGIEGHESVFWMCAWSEPDFAARMLAKGREGRWRYEVSSDIADELSKHLAGRHPDLKVVWFYPESSGGGISKYSGARCSFDLRKVVEWLSDNAKDGPYLFGSEDMGYCLSWRGPAIPPKFLRWSKS